MSVFCTHDVYYAFVWNGFIFHRRRIWNWIHVYVPSHIYSNSQSKQMMKILNWLVRAHRCAVFRFFASALNAHHTFMFACRVRIVVVVVSFLLFIHFVVIIIAMIGSYHILLLLPLRPLPFANAFSLTILILMVNYLDRCLWYCALLSSRFFLLVGFSPKIDSQHQNE